VAVNGYVEYKSREFCNDIKCRVQLALNAREKGSEEYERIRQMCMTKCEHTAWEFHHWLMDKGYLIIRPGK
jgi:hypothetical protein